MDTTPLTPAEIRFHLDTVGVTQHDVAVSLGIGDAMVSLTIAGLRRASRVRRAIAVAIRRSYREVWGDDDPDDAPNASVKNFTTPGEADGDGLPDVHQPDDASGEAPSSVSDGRARRAPPSPPSETP